jgi:hypothetical protein
VNELHSDTLWKTITALARKAGVKRAAVAYVSSDDLVQFGDGDLLVTVASDAAVAAGQTDAEVLARAKERGADLYSLAGLHTKVLLLDGDEPNSLRIDRHVQTRRYSLRAEVGHTCVGSRQGVKRGGHIDRGVSDRRASNDPQTRVTGNRIVAAAGNDTGPARAPLAAPTCRDGRGRTEPDYFPDLPRFRVYSR